MKLLSKMKDIMSANMIVAVAEMEGGALPSVIGVPTSIGYGASLPGVSALLTMLNSCAPGNQRRQY